MSLESSMTPSLDVYSSMYSCLCSRLCTLSRYPLAWVLIWRNMLMDSVKRPPLPILLSFFSLEGQCSTLYISRISYPMLMARMSSEVHQVWIRAYDWEGQVQCPLPSFSAHTWHRGNINLPLILMGSMGNSNLHGDKNFTFIKPK